MTNRILRVVLLLLWFELGVTLILLPWSDYWDVNYFLYQYPSLALLLKNSYLRGMISGLGVMNIMFALEAFRRRTPIVVTPLLTIQLLGCPRGVAVRRFFVMSPIEKP
jgi:hypothetical protein